MQFIILRSVLGMVVAAGHSLGAEALFEFGVNDWTDDDIVSPFGTSSTIGLEETNLFEPPIGLDDSSWFPAENPGLSHLILSAGSDSSLFPLLENFGFEEITEPNAGLISLGDNALEHFDPNAGLISLGNTELEHFDPNADWFTFENTELEHFDPEADLFSFENTELGSMEADPTWIADSEFDFIAAENDMACVTDGDEVQLFGKTRRQTNMCPSPFTMPPVGQAQKKPSQKKSGNEATVRFLRDIDVQENLDFDPNPELCATIPNEMAIYPVCAVSGVAKRALRIASTWSEYYQDLRAGSGQQGLANVRTFLYNVYPRKSSNHRRLLSCAHLYKSTAYSLCPTMGSLWCCENIVLRKRPAKVRTILYCVKKSMLFRMNSDMILFTFRVQDSLNRQNLLPSYSTK
jgi:hypothetical protein